MRLAILSKRKSFNAESVLIPPRITLSTEALIVVVGVTGILPVSGEVFDGETTYTWGLDLGPVGAEISGTGANVSITWAPTSDLVRDAPYVFNITLEDSSGSRTSAEVSITVVAETAPTALLTAQWIDVPETYDLTTDAVDWMAWARTAAGDIDRKEGGTTIEGITLLNDEATKLRTLMANAAPAHSWTDGDTLIGVESAASHKAALARWSVSTPDERDFQLDINAAETKQEAYVFCLIRSNADGPGVGTIEVSMDDAVEMVPMALAAGTASTAVYYAMKIGFKASTTGKMLSVLFKPTNTGTWQCLLGVSAAKIIDASDEPALSATPDDFEVDQGTKLTTVIALADAPSGTIALSCAGVPASGEFTDNGDGTGTFVYTAAADAAGTYGLVFSAYVDGVKVAALTRTITHAESAVAPPALTYTASQTATVGVEKVITIGASTADSGSLLSIEATSALPGSATFASLQAVNTAAAEFRWTPIAGDASATPYAITFKCTDASGRVTDGAIALTVS